MTTTFENGDGGIQAGGADDYSDDAAQPLLLPRVGASDDRAGDLVRTKPKLQRQITLVGAVAMTVSTVIGSGIFVSPNGVVREVHSVGVALLIWLACGLAASSAALCMCELGCAIPSAGGVYAFMLRIYGKQVAFMFVWTFDLVSNPAGLAIIHLTLSKYFLTLFVAAPPDWAEKVCAAAFIASLCLVNCIGVRFLTHVQTFLMFFKLLAILIIVIAGSIYLGQGHTQHIKEVFTNQTVTPTSFTYAFYGGLWAYNGWDTIFHAGEEMENMATTLPLAIKIGMAVVITAYLLANVAYMSLLSSTGLIHSKAVAEAAVIVSLGKVFGTIVIPLFVALSCMGASNGSIFMVGRQVFAAAREGQFPHFLSLLHPKRNTPVPALIFPCVISTLLLFLPTTSIESLIQLSQFTMWIFYGLCFAGIIVLRIREPNLKRPYKTWIAIPVMLTLLSLYLLVTPFIRNPVASVVVLAIVLLSLPVYFLVIVHSCFAKAYLQAVSAPPWIFHPMPMMMGFYSLLDNYMFRGHLYILIQCINAKRNVMPLCHSCNKYKPVEFGPIQPVGNLTLYFSVCGQCSR